jgi:hypothetical protein
LNGGVYGTSTIEGNYFLDNWNGVTLWENADRFGHDESANTSKGYTTLVIDPEGESPSPEMPLCGKSRSRRRSHVHGTAGGGTQNVHVVDNDFIIRDRAAMGCTGHACSQQAIFANYGTVPAWSPYLGRIIQDGITHDQNNRFADNRYVGDWRFVAYEAVGSTLPMEQWQAEPYAQDDGSTFERGGTSSGTHEVDWRVVECDIRNGMVPPA